VDITEFNAGCNVEATNVQKFKQSLLDFVSTVTDESKIQDVLYDFRFVLREGEQWVERYGTLLLKEGPPEGRTAQRLDAYQAIKSLVESRLEMLLRAQDIAADSALLDEGQRRKAGYEALGFRPHEGTESSLT